MRARPVVLAALVTVAVVIGATTATVPAQPAPPALTPEQALRILRDFERVNERNNETLDVDRQATIEAPPILPIDDANFRELRARGETSLDEQVRIDRRRVYVPELTGYPLQFLASERSRPPDGPGVTQLLLFVRPDEGTPWKVSMAALLHRREPKLAVNDDGFARLSDADHAGGLVLPPDGLATTLAGIWAQGDALDDPAPFAPGPYTDGAVSLFVGALAQRGIDAVLDFQASPADVPPVSYRTADGGALSFFVIATTETLRSEDPDGVLEQPASRERFTGLVVPGRYSEVRYEHQVIVAARVPPASDRAHIDVVGIYEGIVTATTTAAGTGPEVVT